MRELEEIVEEVTEIYLTNCKEAEEYLQKARRLERKFGSGFAIVYCWFYSVPQKWTQVEPKIFELARYASAFDLNVVLSIPLEDMARILKPLVFHNQISIQLKNFCKAIHDEFHSWDVFVDELMRNTIFGIFERLRRHKGTRLSFKNLAAMKIFVGMEDNLVILDRHVARVFGLNKREQDQYRTEGKLFQNLLEISENVTKKLKERGLNDVTMVKWSLSVWFNGAKISASELL